MRVRLCPDGRVRSKASDLRSDGSYRNPEFESRSGRCYSNPSTLARAGIKKNGTVSLKVKAHKRKPMKCQCPRDKKSGSRRKEDASGRYVLSTHERDNNASNQKIIKQ